MIQITYETALDWYDTHLRDYEEEIKNYDLLAEKESEMLSIHDSKGTMGKFIDAIEGTATEDQLSMIRETIIKDREEGYREEVKRELGEIPTLKETESSVDTREALEKVRALEIDPEYAEEATRTLKAIKARKERSLLGESIDQRLGLNLTDKEQLREWGLSTTRATSKTISRRFGLSEEEGREVARKLGLKVV